MTTIRRSDPEFAALYKEALKQYNRDWWKCTILRILTFGIVNVNTGSHPDKISEFIPNNIFKF